MFVPERLPRETATCDPKAWSCRVRQSNSLSGKSTGLETPAAKAFSGEATLPTSSLDKGWFRGHFGCQQSPHSVVLAIPPAEVNRCDSINSLVLFSLS